MATTETKSLIDSAPKCPEDLPTYVRVNKDKYERNLAAYLTYRVRSEDQFGWLVLVREGTPAPAYTLED